MPHDETFQDKVFADRPFDEEVESCTFTDCDLGESDLSGLLIVDTTFKDCDLRMVKLGGARLQGVRFVDCRLTGVMFSDCNQFALQIALRDCDASYAGFSQLGLSGAKLTGCTLKGADFTGTDLSNADLSDCDLLEAIFRNTNLMKADLRESVNFDIDPELNRVRGARFLRDALGGLLLRHELKVE